MIRIIGYVVPIFKIITVVIALRTNAVLFVMSLGRAMGVIS